MSISDEASCCRIRELSAAQLQQASDVWVEGMLDNPLHVAAFGSDPNRRRRSLSRFLEFLASHIAARGNVFGAFVQGELVGVLAMLSPGHCRPGMADKLGFLGMIIASNPVRNVSRVGRWLAAWARNDPDELHWHVGPLAVLPQYRRQGIGRQLMAHACAYIDDHAASAYLETDLAINAAFYETLGFVVVRQRAVLGVPNWFMYRTASGARS